MKSTVWDKLYQGIKANRATDDIPSRAKSKGSETMLPEGSLRGGRHDVDGIGSPTDKVFMSERGGGNTLTGAVHAWYIRAACCADLKKEKEEAIDRAQE